MKGPNAKRKWLIVLRGVPAAGKSSVAESLIRKLGNSKCANINLDDINPPPDFSGTLKFPYVIGELFSGQHHSANPATWLHHYRSADYDELSVVLKVSYDIGLARYKADRKRQANPQYWTDSRFEIQYDRFQNEDKFRGFSAKIGMKEIEIDVDNMTPDQVADEIIGHLN
jgi:thymidylate kinase